MSDRVLGIDPAGGKIALAHVDEDGFYLKHWVLTTKAASGPQRLAWWRKVILAGRHEFFEDVVCVVVEVPWFGGNKSSWTLLSTAAVAVEACAAATQVPVFDLTTGTWKKQSVGHGNAGKAETLRQAKGLGMPLDCPSCHGEGKSCESKHDAHDVADALCMAQTGARMYARSLEAA